MTEVDRALAVVGTVSVLVVLALAWRRWGRCGLAGAAVGTLAVLGWLVALLRRRRPPVPVVSTSLPDPGRAYRERAAKALRDAERARLAAERIAADVDTAGDAEALVAHLTRRSEEG